MLIKLDKIIVDFNLKIKGVLHIGAHYGQEYSDYARHGIKNMIFFEPLSSNFAKLLETLPEKEGITAYNFALGNEVGTREMFVETANKGQSCSFLEPGTHLTLYPHIQFPAKETVSINMLDNIPFKRDDFNMINIDVQGFEMEVFKGATATLDSIDIIYTEINDEDIYKGCCHVDELDIFLGEHHFTRVTTLYPQRTPTEKYPWGDALYLRNK